MKILKPDIPFIWPEPRVQEHMAEYEEYPPYTALVLKASSVFGVISSLTVAGLDLVEQWLKANTAMKASIIVAVYPACSTQSSDLTALLDLVHRNNDRLFAHIWPLADVVDRVTNALCFSSSESGFACIVTGASEDLGISFGHANFNLAFAAAPALLHDFKCYFDWLWTVSCNVNTPGATAIPSLRLPEGSQEAAANWQAYLNSLLSPAQEQESPKTTAHIDPNTGDVTIKSSSGQEQKLPTDEIGVKKVDPIALRIAAIYQQGALVSVDKLSRIPPLDAPVEPEWFGERSEQHQGAVTKKVSVRVSVIGEKTLKSIEARRTGLRTLLCKFSFGLADNMRWMPYKARELFERELKRINDEGKQLISDLLSDNVDAFLAANRPGLTDDLRALFSERGKSDRVSDDMINKVIASLRERLSKAQSGNFMPKLSYSVIGFHARETEFASPWGQAWSLLSEVATFPRRAITDSFFFRGLKTPKQALLAAMNIADDALLRDSANLATDDRCVQELALIANIEKAQIDSKLRCELVLKLLDGTDLSVLYRELENASSGNGDSLTRGVPA